jgi:hypothetical protein
MPPAVTAHGSSTGCDGFLLEFMGLRSKHDMAIRHPHVVARGALSREPRLCGGWEKMGGEVERGRNGAWEGMAQDVGSRHKLVSSACRNVSREPQRGVGDSSLLLLLDFFTAVCDAHL